MRSLVRAFYRANQALKQSTTVYMVVVASLVGLIAGYGAVGLRLMIRWFKAWIWDTPGLPDEAFDLLLWVQGLPWWWLVLAPTVGGFVVGLLVHYGAKEAKGHGVPEVMEAVAIRQGRIRPRVVGVKALASSLCIASGGSVGREGPIVQIGSAIGSTIGQILRLGPRRMRTLVGCGAAAGIAAAFNAPVAGALFAVEIILGDFGVPQFSPIVISSVVATVVARHFLGDFPAFEIPAYSLHHAGELAAYAVLGFLAGITAIVFTRVLHWSEEGFERLPIWGPLKTTIGGLAVGLLAVGVPQVLGVGYEAMNTALTGQATLLALLGFLGAKLLAVCLTLGSGGSGGIFAPSLFLGSMLGGAVGVAVDHWFPGAAPPGAYALVGMGAVVAAATHAPITAIMVLFELTTDYKIILPLMISCIIGTLVMSRLHKESIYTIKLKRRGINIRAGQDVDLLRSIPVREVMRREPAVAAPGDPLLPVLQRLYQGEDDCIYVVDKGGRLTGVIALNHLRSVLEDLREIQELLVADDVAVAEWPAAQAGDTLDRVVRRLEQGYRDELPVLEEGRLVGVVHVSDVLDRYRREVFKHQMADTLAGSLPVGSSEETPVRRVGDNLMAEVDAPPQLVGRTLAEADFRARFGVNVLLVKPPARPGQESAPHAPAADYRFQLGDRLVVFGPPEAVRRLRVV
ncbi:MAG: CBS domain-containing protein [Planctomycetota bacterium]|nr:MAG: CBS domain-containing protein [Planctomycetota bacterium]